MFSAFLQLRIRNINFIDGIYFYADNLISGWIKAVFSMTGSWAYKHIKH